MGGQHSFPTHKMESLYFMASPRGKKMNLGRKSGKTRLLIWRVYQTGADLAIDADAALCFGDIPNVLYMIACDDAEFDGLDEGEDESDEGRWRRRLHPPGYHRVEWREGEPYVLAQPSRPKAIFAGRSLPPNRQIYEDTGLQRGTVIHVLIPPLRSPWHSLPRGDPSLGRAQPGWALPVGWDDGATESVANFSELQLSGRRETIRRNLIQIMAHPNLRILRWRKAARIRFACDADGEVATDVDELMRGVTDRYDDLTPQDLLVAITPPRDSLYCGHPHTPSTYVVQVQLPPTYPLAPARYRILTPMLHPFVAPLWSLDLPDLQQDDPRDLHRSRRKKRRRAEDQDEEAHQGEEKKTKSKRKREGCADEEHDREEEKEDDDGDDENDDDEEDEDDWSGLVTVDDRAKWERLPDLVWNADDEADWLYSPSFTDGGRLASVPTHPAEVLDWLVTTMECPSLWARRMLDQPKCVNATPIAHRRLLRHFASEDPIVRLKMEDRAKVMASLVANGMRWRPQVHHVCPRSFRVEVRTLRDRSR